MAQSNLIRIAEEQNQLAVHLGGQWRLSDLRQVEEELKRVSWGRNGKPAVVLDGKDLEAIDTAGALLLLDTLHEHGPEAPPSLRNFKKEHEALLQLVADRFPAQEKARRRDLGALGFVGRTVVQAASDIREAVAFLGRFVCEAGALLTGQRTFRMKELVVQLELSCVNAIPVIVLVNFLIGLVVAYLFADQVKRYGANIFIVDGVTVAMSRELTPLIVAIVVAGRSGSSFTAQLGSMKVSEELDAIRAIGLSLMQVLVVPRVLALCISLPLLVLVGDLIGILGGIIIANIELSITSHTFLQRVQDNVAYRHFIIGLVKAPVFALFIALIGCRMGLSVERNTRSVGIHTTSTVVQSIVAVILLDAFFAVLFMKLNL